MQMPTKKEVEKALELIGKSAANYEYFFSRLDNPEWISPLLEKGLFKDPPPIARNEENEIVGVRWWPQSQFLAKVASKAPEEVLKVALNIETDNYAVMTDLTEAALVMPVQLAEKWGGKLYRWIDKGHYFHDILASKAASLLSMLAVNKRIGVALGLANSLLTVMPDPKASEKEETASGEVQYALPLEPSLRCSQHEYEEILKNNIPDLYAVAPGKTLMKNGDFNHFIDAVTAV